MIKNGITRCDNDDELVYNTEWSIIHVITAESDNMKYVALDFCDFKCMLKWCLSQAVEMKIMQKGGGMHFRLSLDDKRSLK